MQNGLEKLCAADTRIFFWLCGYRILRPVEHMSRWISRCGDGYLYAAVGLLLFVFEPQDGQVFFTTALLAFSVELPIYLLLKNTIQRDRPCHRLKQVDALVYPSDRFSFPSGHAAAAFLFASIVAAYYPAFGVWMYGIASLIGLSRVLLGVHYPADIIAGALLGFVSAQGVLWLMG